MSGKLEIRSYLNLGILEAINSAIEEKVLPRIQNAVQVPNADSDTKVDLRSQGQQQNPNVDISHKTRVDFPKLESVKSNHNHHQYNVKKSDKAQSF